MIIRLPELQSKNRQLVIKNIKTNDMREIKIYLNLFRNSFIEITPFEWWIIPDAGSSHQYYSGTIWLDRKDRGVSEYSGDKTEARDRIEGTLYWFSFLFFTFKISLERLTVWGKQFPKGYHSLQS